MIEIAFIAAYLALALLLIQPRTALLAVLPFVVYLVAYDYLFLHLEQWLGRSLVPAKTFSEVLLITSVVVVFAVQVRRRVWRALDFAFMGLLAVVTVVGLVVTRAAPTTALEDYRVLLAPVVLASLLSLSVRPDPVGLRRLRVLLLGLGAVAVLIAALQYATFDGNPQSTWRHDFLLALKLEQNPDYRPHFIQYSIVRNGALRASSVFISAIDFSVFAAFFGLLAFVSLVHRRRPIDALWMVASVLGVAVSQVRIGFIVLAFGWTLTLLLASRWRTIRASVLLSPLLAIVVILAYVALGGGLNDPSSMGRLPQYAFLLDEFSLGGAGFGSYKGRFDSFLIYTGLTLGAGALLWGLSIAWLALRLERADHHLMKRGGHVEERILVRFALVQLLSAIVVFSVHHTVGSVSYFLVFLLAFLATRVDRSPRTSWFASRLPQEGADSVADRADGASRVHLQHRDATPA